MLQRAQIDHFSAGAGTVNRAAMPPRALRFGTGEDVEVSGVADGLEGSDLLET